MGDRIFLSSPHMSDEGYEQAYIKEAFDTNWIAPLGKNVDAFEKEVMEKLGVNACVALSSGTAAIHMALKSVNVTKGDIVICQSLTFSASANPILYEHATPIFIDSEIDSWNMSPKALERAILDCMKHGTKPKAVIVVHLYGIPANIIEICDICKKYEITLIEDAAESLGSSVNGKYTGTFGDYGILSFNGNKIITTSGGGMLLCNTIDAQTRAEKVLFWATQAREKERHYEHKEIGYNYRLSNVLAGIGRGQCKVLDQRVNEKRKIYETYLNAFADITDITMMPYDVMGSHQNCWLSVLQIAKNAQVKPIDILMALEKENIESRPVWKPMHMQPIFKEYRYYDNGAVAEDLFENGLCLPSDTNMNAQQQDSVISIIKGCWNK